MKTGFFTLALAFALMLSVPAFADYPALQRWVSNTEYVQGIFGSRSACKDAVDKKMSNQCVWTDGYGGNPLVSMCIVNNGNGFPCRPISSCPYGGSLRGNVCANTDVSAEPDCFGLNSEQLMGNGGNIYNCENDRIMRYEPAGSETVSTPSEGSDPDLPPYLACGDYIKSDTGKSCGPDNSGVPGGAPTDKCAKDDYQCWKDCYESGHACVAEIGDSEGGDEGKEGEGADGEGGDGKDGAESDGDNQVGEIGDGKGEGEGEGKGDEEGEEEGEEECPDYLKWYCGKGEEPKEPEIKDNFDDTFFKGTFDGLKGWSFPSCSGNCQAMTFNIPLFRKGYSISEHCDLMMESLTVFASVMTAVWSIIALFVVLRA